MILHPNQACRRGFWAWMSTLPREHWFGLLLLSLVQLSLLIGQMATAYTINSIALKATGYHTGLALLLTASRILTEALRTKQPNDTFSYGYGRFSVLLEFTGITVLSILSLSAAVEAILRLNSHSSVLIDASLGDPMHIHKSEHTKTHAFAASALVFGLIQGALSIALRAVLRSDRFHPLPESARRLQRRSSVRVSIAGFDMDLHISLFAWSFMIISAFIASSTGWWALDSVAALASLGLLLPIMYDLLAKTSPILLQTAPAGPLAAFDKASREVSTFDGVLDCKDEHFWVNASGVYVGSINVRVREGVNVQDMLGRVKKRFAGAVHELTVQIQVVRDGGSSYIANTSGVASTRNIAALRAADEDGVPRERSPLTKVTIPQGIGASPRPSKGSGRTPVGRMKDEQNNGVLPSFSALESDLSVPDWLSKVNNSQ